MEEAKGKRPTGFGYSPPTPTTRLPPLNIPGGHRVEIPTFPDHRTSRHDSFPSYDNPSTPFSSSLPNQLDLFRRQPTFGVDASSPHLTPPPMMQRPAILADDGPPTYTPVTHRLSKAKKGKKVHVCQYPGCNKVFTRAEHRRRHELNHNPEATHQCQAPGCTKVFHRPDLLARHMERHQFNQEDELEIPTSSSRKSSRDSQGSSATTESYPSVAALSPRDSAGAATRGPSKSHTMSIDSIVDRTDTGDYVTHAACGPVGGSSLPTPAYPKYHKCRFDHDRPNVGTSTTYFPTHIPPIIDVHVSPNVRSRTSFIPSPIQGFSNVSYPDWSLLRPPLTRYSPDSSSSSPSESDYPPEPRFAPTSRAVFTSSKRDGFAQTHFPSSFDIPMRSIVGMSETSLH